MNFRAWLTPATLVGVGKEAWFNALGAGLLLCASAVTYHCGTAILAVMFGVVSLLLWWLSVARRPPVTSGPGRPIHHPHIVPNKRLRRVFGPLAFAVAFGALGVLGVAAWQRSVETASQARKHVAATEHIDKTTTRTEGKVDELARLLADLDRRLKSEGEQASLSEADRVLLANAKALGDAKTQARAAIIGGDFEEADRIITEIETNAGQELFESVVLRGDLLYYAGEFDAAIEPYEKALAFSPDDWVSRNNATIALSQASQGDITIHRRRAIEIGQGTLERYPREIQPEWWATTQNNIGNAWAGLITENRGSNLHHAIRCYLSALEVYSRAEYPESWAMTTNNLCIALADLPGERATENLVEAIECFLSVLEVYTRSEHPSYWAAVHNNLSIAMGMLSEQPGQDRCALLARAIAYGKGSLTIRTPDAMPHEHADTAGILAIVRRAYEAAACSPPFDEIRPAE